MIIEDLRPSSYFFEGTDPIIDIEGLGQSWINIQEWADLSFPLELPESIPLEDIQGETQADGGVRFCCYGMASQLIR